MQAIKMILTESVLSASHCYGAFNLAFSTSAFVGPIIAGQILQATGTATGFKIQCGLTAALALLCIPLAFVYMRLPMAEKPSTELSEPDAR